MSYRHLYDIPLSSCKNVTKFTETELNAVSLLAKYADGKLTKDDFGEEMMRIADDFNNMMTDEDGCYVMNADAPAWLVMFLGNKFARWNKVRLVFNQASKNVKMTSDPNWDKFELMVSGEDSALMSAVIYCLDEWDRNNH